jgi:hypothetical protein
MSNFKLRLLITALAMSSTLTRGADKPEEISFKLVQGFAIVVRGEIGSRHDLNFLLDTGASPVSSVKEPRPGWVSGERQVRWPC